MSFYVDDNFDFVLKKLYILLKMEVVGGFHTLPKDIVENSVNLNGGRERFLYLSLRLKYG